MGPGALREGRQVQDFGRKAHSRRVFPDRGVKAGSAVEVPRVQGVNSSETLDPLFERDKQGFTREEVSPGPGATKGPNRETFRQCVIGESGDQAMFSHQLRRDERERREARGG